MNDLLRRPGAARGLLVLFLIFGLVGSVSAQRYDRQGKNEENVLRDLRLKIMAMSADAAYGKAFTDALEAETGRRLSMGDALTWLKIAEAAASGQVDTARDEAAKWAIGKASPMAGHALAAVGALKVTADAIIANWVEDLYATPAYYGVGNLLVETLVERAKKDRSFMPSIWIKGFSESDGVDSLAETMRTAEGEMFERWRNEYQVDIDTLEYTMGSRLRQELGYDPTERQLFNHFYAMTARDMRGFILSNFQRIEAKAFAMEVHEDLFTAHGATIDGMNESKRRDAWDTIAHGPKTVPPPMHGPWEARPDRSEPQQNPTTPSVDIGPYGTILDNGIPEWMSDDSDRMMTYPTLPPYTQGWLQPPPPAASPPPSGVDVQTSTGDRHGSWGWTGPIPTTSQAGSIPTTEELRRADGSGGWTEPFICGTRRKDGAARLDGYPHGMSASAAFCAGGRGYDSVQSCRANSGCFTVDLCSRVGRWDNPCVEFGVCCPAR